MHIRYQLQQQHDNLLHLQHLWATPLVSGIPYALHVNAADALVNRNTSYLTWLPIAAAPTSEAFETFSISNGQESDKSDMEEPDVINGVDGVGQVLLAEVLEEVEEGDDDDDDGGAQLSALGATVWQTLVSTCLVILRPSSLPCSEARAYLRLSI